MTRRPRRRSGPGSSGPAAAGRPRLARALVASALFTTLLAALLATEVAAHAQQPLAPHASLDPARAQADVDAAMAERAFTFCSEPREPLSPEARALCAHAKEIPGCAGFAKACTSTPAPDSPSWLERVARALSRHVPEFVKSLVRALTRLPAAIFLLLVAALAIAGLALVVRSIARLKRDSALHERPRAPPGSSADLVDVVEASGEEALLALADGHARRGNDALALQLYLAASLRALDKRGAVRLAKDRTNGEYVRSCAEEGSRPALREIVREVDRVQFGKAAPPPNVVARAGKLAVGIVRLLPVALLLSVLPAIAGCNQLKGPRAGDDPAGNELLFEVLQRQGVHVEPLDVPLGALPLPPPPLPRGGRAPALVIDVDQTPLDEDTRAHLAAWVYAGGYLVLAGSPGEWPQEFGAKTGCSGSHGLTAQPTSDQPLSPMTRHAELAEPAAFEFKGRPVADPGAATDAGDDDDDDNEVLDGDAVRVAWLDDGTTYAATTPSGRGTVLGLATDELTTNAGLARPGNAAALVAILSNTNRSAFQIAQPEDGVTPPSSPISALRRAGLGLALAHGLVATLVLFLAAGVRLARPRPAAPPLRRAFAEHVEAVGALYARTGSAGHALAAYARFAEQRLRTRMPRGTTDVAGFLASRSRLPLDVCQELWARATAAMQAEPRSARGASDPPAGADADKPDARAGHEPEPKNTHTGDELMVLKELSAAYSAAMAQDK